MADSSATSSSGRWRDLDELLLQPGNIIGDDFGPGPVIIGAGPSGLATAACLKQQGVLLLILESESCLASLWKLKSYDRLRLHLPKTFCHLPYMVFLPDFPAYPTKEHFIDYLEMYAKHFSIEPIFEEEVKLAKYDSTICVWLVRANKTEYVCRWLIVATGENSEPVSPEIAQTSDFQGRVLHTSSYENGENFEQVKVLVVGVETQAWRLAWIFVIVVLKLQYQLEIHCTFYRGRYLVDQPRDFNVVA